MSRVSCSLPRVEERRLEVIGVIIAIISALFVLVHARMRQLPFWSIVGWVAGTFLLMIVVLPIYFFVHVLKPRNDRDERHTRDR